LGERIFGQYGVYDGTYDTKDYNGGKVYNGYDGRDGYNNHMDGNKTLWEIRVMEIYDEKGTDGTKTMGSSTRGVSTVLCRISMGTMYWKLTGFNKMTGKDE